jgi:hypothetical protein
MPLCVVIPRVDLQERVLGVGRRLNLPPLALEHVLARIDQLPSARDGRRVDQVGGHPGILHKPARNRAPRSNVTAGSPATRTAPRSARSASYKARARCSKQAAGSRSGNNRPGITTARPPPDLRLHGVGTGSTTRPGSSLSGLVLPTIYPARLPALLLAQPRGAPRRGRCYRPKAATAGPAKGVRRVREMRFSEPSAVRRSGPSDSA